MTKIGYRIIFFTNTLRAKIMGKATSIILSAGQLVDFKITKCVHAFTVLSAEASVLPFIIAYPIFLLNTVLRYLYDSMVSCNIHDYKNSKIDTPAFFTFLRSQFGNTLTDLQLTTAWNAGFDRAQGLKNIDSLTNFIKKHDDCSVILVSFTNHLHVDYMKSNFPQIFNNPNISTRFSTEYPNLSLSQLANKALQEKELGAVVSLHLHIKGKDLEVNVPVTESSYSLKKHGLVGDYLETMLGGR